MYLTLPLTLPFVDADRKGGNAPKPDGLSYRACFTIALAVLFVVWLFLRVNHYFR